MSPAIIFLCLFILFIILLIVRSIELGNAIEALLFNQPLPIYFELFYRKLPAKYERYLVKNDKYYRMLSPRLKRSYGSRIMKFIASKEFESGQGLRLTTEMILVVASAAVKITFGLPNYQFSTFSTIRIYPDEFFSKASNHYVKGETNASGIILFSWRDLEFGISNPHDSINLGYHEFAHALFIEHLMSSYEDAFKTHYREWLAYLKTHDKLSEVKQKHIFRDYATVNEFEFFAVALENFFERPEHFKKELPRLYEYMTLILNQDTLMETRS